MQPHEHESPVDWLAAPGVIGQLELAQACGLGSADIDELVDYGVLVAEGPPEGPRVFSAEWVQPLREACRLREVFDLDLFAAGLLLAGFQRIRQLEQQLRRLEAQLPRPQRSAREGPAPWREPHGRESGSAGS